MKSFVNSSGPRPRQRSVRALLLGVVLGCALSLPGCKRALSKPPEVAYVSAPQVNLRDRVAAVYNKTGVLHNGENVEILDRSRRFVKVRSVRGEIGWVEERYLADAEVFAGFEKLAVENAKAPVQAEGTTRATTNMHVTPGRESEHLYQLKEGEKVLILKRATAEKPEAARAPAPPPVTREKKSGAKSAKKKSEEPEGPPLEDWWLARDPRGHTGWVLPRLVDLNTPLDIAQYAEGQRIVAYFVLNQVQDGDHKVAQYLVLLTEPKDGLPFDYDQARVFTWNAKRHHYETAYRERRLTGVFPARVGSEDFGKEGVLPTFTLRVQGENGNPVDRKYKLNGPIVRRVLSPEELQAKGSGLKTPARKRKR